MYDVKNVDLVAAAKFVDAEVRMVQNGYLLVRNRKHPIGKAGFFGDHKDRVPPPTRLTFGADGMWVGWSCPMGFSEVNSMAQVQPE
jgi:hypothetical protein